MAKHVPDAGSYAPVTVLVDERADGVHLSYDKMASLLPQNIGRRASVTRNGLLGCDLLLLHFRANENAIGAGSRMLDLQTA